MKNPFSTPGRKLFLAIVVLYALSWWLTPKNAPEASVAVSLASEELFFLGKLPVTNTLFWSIVLSVILMGIALFLRFFLHSEPPGGFQNVVELAVEKFFAFMTGITGSEAKTRRIFPLAFTLFVFILFANVFTLFPGVSAVTLYGKPFFRAVASDYNFVLSITLITVILIQIVAIVTQRPLGYLKKFLNFSSPLNFFLGFMDLVGEISKVISLSFRLFGNIFAGEVLAAVMLFLLPYILPVPFLLTGLLTGIIQAFVFSLLTIIFLSMASEKASHDA